MKSCLICLFSHFARYSRKALFGLAALCAGLFLTQRAGAGVAYSDPVGGWTYIYDGSQTNGLGVYRSPVCLDNTWSSNNGSSEWDGSWRGAGNGQPGGISSDGNVLTIEDVNIGSGTGNNRKIYFTRDLAQDPATTGASTILDTGITITFRARLPTSDPLTEIPLPDGWGVFSEGKANFNVHQYNGTHSIIGFSLVRQTEPDNSFNFSAAGLTMNRLNGDAPAGGGAVNSSGTAANNQVLPLDPTQFHEFWITIQANDGTAGNGTHTVNIYVDGSTTPTGFNVTAGTGNESTANYLAMGLNNSVGEGCVDIDFFGYKQGVLTPLPISPPPAPTNVIAANGDAKVTLSWSAAPSASGYSVLRSDTSGGPYTSIADVSGTSYMDTAVVNGGTYYYVIQATNLAGVSPNSAEVIGRPNIAVADLTATGGTGEVALAWSALGGATSYSVLRSSDAGGPYTTVASGLTTTSYVDTTVEAGRRYYYVVLGELSGGAMSGLSNEATAITAPNAPVVTASVWAATVIRLSWTTSDTVAPSGFNLEQSTDGVNFSVIANVPGTQRSYTNSDLTLGSTYYYRVQAQNASGTSPYSNIASATTPSSGINVNFGSALNGQPANNPSPTPPGYAQDIGELFGLKTNGLTYGWDRDITADSRWRMNANSPDLRWDTFNHFQKLNPSAIWELEIPTGFYSIYIVSGDPNNVDSLFQLDIEGFITPTYSPGAGRPNWAQFTAEVPVEDGRLTITTAPNLRNVTTNNNKINFIDIYPATPVGPTITAQPQNAAGEEFKPASVSVGVSGSFRLVYQWYHDGNPVADGTNATLSFPYARTSDSGQYFVIVTNWGGSVTSTVAALTISPDTTAPVVTGAESLDGNTVGICFSEEMENGLDEMTDPFNYFVNGAPLSSNIVVRADRRSVILQLSSPISGDYTVEINTQGQAHRDLAGNPVPPTTLSRTVAGYFAGDIGGPGLAGSHFSCGDEIEIVGGGADVWGASDQLYFVAKSVDGNFDARVHVTSLVGVNAITKALLLARENNDANARAYHISVNPTPGRNQLELGFRSTVGGATASWGATVVPAGIPNVWMRITRVGDTFTGYRSTDGWNWIALGTNTLALPSTMSVGIGVTAHNNTQLATGVFSNFGIIQEEPPPRLSIARQGANVRICWPRTAGTYVLEEADALRPPVIWLPSEGVLEVSPNENCAIANLGTGNRFFRLVRDPHLFLNLLDGNRASLDSGTSTATNPVTGFLGFDELPSTALAAGSLIELRKASLDIPVNIPLGLLHLELRQPASLLVNPDHSATGPLSLVVSVPLYGTSIVTQAAASLEGSPYPYKRLRLGFSFALNNQFLQASYVVTFDANLSQEIIFNSDILKLIAQLDDDDIQVRERALLELFKIGRPALAKLKAKLADDPSAEQEVSLKQLITGIEGVTTPIEPEWIGNGVGVYNFKFNVHVPPGHSWSRDVCDFHFIVGTRDQSAIDHTFSTITNNLPEGWTGRYDPDAGEYKFECSSLNPVPLTPCQTYMIGFRTPSMRRLPDGSLPQPGSMGWYWTDANHGKIGDSGKTRGPVFIK